MIIVPQKLALGLIPELSDDEKIDAAWERVQKLIEEGEIKLVTTLLAKGHSGENLLSETIEEMRYPTEFDPPQLPSRIPEENATEFLKAWPVIGVTPTAFETRNVGQTLELQAFVSNDGQWINTKMNPRHVRFLRFMHYGSGRLPNGEQLGVEQPFFHTLSNRLSLRLRNGQRVLAGVHRPPEPNEKAFELFVIQLKATQRGTKE